MKHNTFFDSAEALTAITVPSKEFTVCIHDAEIVVFSWNSIDISEIARTLGEPEIDLEYCG